MNKSQQCSLSFVVQAYLYYFVLQNVDKKLSKNNCMKLSIPENRIHILGNQ